MKFKCGIVVENVEIIVTKLNVPVENYVSRNKVPFLEIEKNI